MCEPKVGDTVMLRSGGPWMICGSVVTGTNRLRCHWLRCFAGGTPECCSEEFSSAALEVVQEARA